MNWGGKCIEVSCAEGELNHDSAICCRFSVLNILGGMEQHGQGNGK
jgi:hypothetical protein